MTWVVKISLALCILLSFLGMAVPANAMANGELTRVTVAVKIEKPDYFWQYPFWGKQLDRISISSFGKTFTISSLSDNEKIELDVPTNYHLRMNIALQNNGSTLQNVSYVSKSPIKQSNAFFTIVLKAPEPQPVSIASDDFEISRP